MDLSHNTLDDDIEEPEDTHTFAAPIAPADPPAPVPLETPYYSHVDRDVAALSRNGGRMWRSAPPYLRVMGIGTITDHQRIDYHRPSGPGPWNDIGPDSRHIKIRQARNNPKIEYTGTISSERGMFGTTIAPGPETYDYVLEIAKRQQGQFDPGGGAGGVY